jgi:hypothetical protein
MGFRVIAMKFEPSIQMGLLCPSNSRALYKDSTEQFS